jgi:hypothetical protein
MLLANQSSLGLDPHEQMNSSVLSSSAGLQ